MQLPMTLPKSHRQIARWYWLFATGWFMTAILMGWGLRMALSGYAYDGMVFSYWRHAHSHVAFLGWLYNALVGLTLWVFPLKENYRWHLRWMLLGQIAVAGMALSFPWQGYGAIAIAFSTLHMVASFGVVYRLVKDQPRQLPPTVQQAFRVMYIALLCMVLSGLGPIALGPLASLDLQGSVPYRLAIYFYLHFQYNGWFILQALALWLMQRSFQRHRQPVPGVTLIVAGTFLTFAQSALWSTDKVWVWAIAGMGGMAQLIGWGQLLRSVVRERPLTKPYRWADVSLLVAVLALVLKLVLQLGMVVPSLAAVAHQHPVVIAFLHLIFLGVLTPFLWGRCEVFRLVAPAARWERWSGILFLLAFASLEVALLLPTVWGVYGWPWTGPQVLLGLTTLMALALLIGMVGLQNKLIQYGRS